MFAELSGRGVQNDSVKISNPQPVAMIKFVIQDGHDDFTSVHSVEFK